MSWLKNVNERGTLITIDGENGSSYNYRITPCKREGSYACFLDLATLPDYRSGAQIKAIAELIHEIESMDMQPVVAPDNRPLPASADGVKRKVGGVMVYANTKQLTIKPKVVVPND